MAKIIDQTKAISNTVRVIKAIQSMIRLKQLTKQKRLVIWLKQSKQYDQQYTQDKPGGGNGYIVNNIYAKAKDLSKGPILRGYRKINSRAILNIIC